MEKAIRKTKETHIGKPYLLSFALFAVSIVIGSFFLENIAFFDPVYTTWMNDFEYYVSLLAVIASLVGYLWFSFRHFDIKLNVPLLFIALILLIGNITALCMFPDVFRTIGHNGKGETYEVIYYLSAANRVRYSLNFFIALIYIYILLSIFPKTIRRNHLTSFVFAMGILVCLFSIGFSLVKEWDKYVIIFNHEIGTKPSIFICSFINNPNVYSSLLLLGIYSCMFLHQRNKHWFYIALIIIFFIAVTFTMSQTGIILAISLVFSFFIYLFFKTFKCHKTKNIVWMSILVFLVALTMLGLFGQVFAGVPGLGALFDFISREAQSSGESLINLRLDSWHSLLTLLDNPLKWIFGFGEYNFGFMFGQFEHNNVPCLNWIHNGFLHQLACGGLIRMIIYVALLGYLFFLIVKSFSRRERTAIASLLFFFITLVQSFTETTAFIMSDSKCMIMILFLICPLINVKETTPWEKKVEITKRKQSLVVLIPLLSTVAFLSALDVTLLIVLNNQFTTYAIVSLCVGNFVSLLSVLSIVYSYIRGEENKGFYALEYKYCSFLDRHEEKIAKRMEKLTLPSLRREMGQKSGLI